MRLASQALMALAGLLCSSCFFTRALYYNVPSLEAPANFDSRPVRASTHPAPLPRSATETAFQPEPAERERYRSFDELLEKNLTRAFVVVHDDTVIYERYFGHVTAATQLPTFSMSKTYAASLVGCALDDGLIGSMDQSVVEYIPELAAKPGYEGVTLDHLLRMTSGIDFDEESMTGAFFYYSINQRNRMYGYDVKWTPGEHYLYGSVNIQLLWDVLHRRLGGRSVSKYFEERFWDPMGAQYPASWSLDSTRSGVEKFFGGFNATARDHARLGLLFLHGGTLNGRSIVSKQWVEASLVPDPVPGVVRTTDGLVRRGRYQWFLSLDGRCFFAKGYHGQYIFVVPDKNTVFVRFGEGYGDIDWTSLFVRLAEAL